jgi:glucose/arabinose dehydrogenase
VKTRHAVLTVAEIACYLPITGFTRSARHLRYGVALALLLAMVQLALRAEVLAAQPLPGFEERAVVEVYGAPTDLAWLGDDLLIATQNGWLFRLESGAPPGAPRGTAQKILDLSSRIGKGPEQGLLGVVADPDFAVRPFVYVYYTGARESGHCLDFPANCYNRVSRFTMGEDGLLDPDSEQPLLDTIMVGGAHNGGDLAFDADNLLYVTTGDAGDWQNGQNLSNLNGKILRIDRDGSPARGNPFSDRDTVACDERQPGESATQCPEIFAYGLRNPFRIAFDPSDQEPVFYINDVGQEVWEEIDVGIAGADYGWPIREGPCPTGMRLPCEPATDSVEPIFAYTHDQGCLSITGGAFVPQRNPWGAAFQDTYLFADWGCGRIFVLSQGEDGRFTASPFAHDLPAITALLFSPDGATLYYTRAGGPEGGLVGAIWRRPGRSPFGHWLPSCKWGASGYGAHSGSGDATRDDSTAPASARAHPGAA